MRNGVPEETGEDVDGVLNPDREGTIPLAKVGGQEGYNVDNSDGGGKRMTCPEIKSRSSYQELFTLYKTPGSSLTP